MVSTKQIDNERPIIELKNLSKSFIVDNNETKIIDSN